MTGDSPVFPPVCADTSLEPEHLSDLGNARRLVQHFGDNFRYVASHERFHVWTGTYWAPDSTRQVERYAKMAVEKIYIEAGYETAEGNRQKLARHAIQSESARSIRAMVELAKSEPAIILPAAALDRDPWLLNCQNGTLDLTTGQLREHRREDFITKVIAIDFDAEGACPTFLRFLDKIFDGRPALVAFMKKAVGYALTGVTSEQVFFVLHGRGANGKSTLVQTIRSLLGGYAGTLSAESLLAKNGNQNTMVMNDLFGVIGARFVAAAESDAGRRLAEGLIKQLTGGETIKVKKLYSDLFEVDNQLKLFLSTNHRPVIRGGSDSMWRRVRLIPFDVVIPDAQQDHQLYDKLHAERPGILRWAVEGCLAWQQEGLAAPEKLRAATSAYREEMDSLGKFFSKHCVFEADAAIAAGALYAEYEHWATGDDESLMSKTAFGLQLKERGLTNGKIKGERSWIGIRLRRPEDEPVDGLVEQDAFEGHFGEITHTRAHSESFSETGSNASNVSSAVPSGPCPGTLEPWATWNLE